MTVPLSIEAFCDGTPSFRVQHCTYSSLAEQKAEKRPRKVLLCAVRGHAEGDA